MDLQEISVIKKQLLFNDSFALLGYLVTSTPFIYSDKVDVIATDGSKIYINTEKFNTFDLESKKFYLASVYLHMAFLHPLRGYNAESKETWQKASDIAVVFKIHYSNLCMNINTTETVNSYRKYKKFTTEQIYLDLLKNDDKNNNSNNPSPNLSGATLKSIFQLPQDLILPQTEEEQKTAQKESLEAISGIDLGDLPKETKQLLEFLNEKHIKFGDILRNYLTEKLNSIRTYRRPNRRVLNSEFILPTYLKDKGRLNKINCYLDTSGSMSDELLNIFNTEMKNLFEDFKPKEMNLICFDTEVHTEYSFKETDSFEDIQINRRGNTCLEDVYKHINKNEPTISFIFTDLKVHIPENKPNTDLVWLCNENLEEKDRPSYGEFIFVDEKVYIK